MELSPKDTLSLFDQDINLTIDPLLFLTLERLCKTALTHSLNHGDVRHAITNLYLHLSRESTVKYGVDSIDVLSLKKTLLDDKVFVSTIEPHVDPIAFLAQGKKPKLGPDLVGSALIIRRIWQGFGKFLKFTARSYSRTGPKKRTKSLDPVMVMTPELLTLWSEQYKPWIAKASKTTIDSRSLTEAQVVLRIVLDEDMPERLDTVYGLNKGQSLRILRKQLRLFVDPDYELRQGNKDEG